jgi:hypothetical protein
VGLGMIDQCSCVTHASSPLKRAASLGSFAGKGMRLTNPTAGAWSLLCYTLQRLLFLHFCAAC